MKDYFLLAEMAKELPAHLFSVYCNSDPAATNFPLLTYLMAQTIIEGRCEILARIYANVKEDDTASSIKLAGANMVYIGYEDPVFKKIDGADDIAIEIIQKLSPNWREMMIEERDKRIAA